MKETNRFSIPFKPQHSAPASLNWDQGTLVDWVNSGTRFHTDGTIEPARIHYHYRFDNAVISPNGQYAVVYERLGTKGLLFKDGTFLREIDRSYYCAEAYEFPVAFLTLPNGGTALAHCPGKYNVLHFEDADTGEILTERDSEPEDFFHSRLSVSSDSRFLASSGWIWHPFEEVETYDIVECLSNPKKLDESKPRLARWGVTVNMAVLHGANQLFFTTASDSYNEENTAEEGRESRLPPGLICIYDVDARKVVKQAKLQEKSGILLPIDSDYVIDCYQHPKLIDLNTGTVVARWEEFDTGLQDSCMIQDFGNAMPVALDAESKRLAIATKEEIVIIQLG